MKDGQRLTHEELQRAARRAYRASDLKQTDIAEALGVSQASISQALSTPGQKFARLQRRIVELLTPYTVEKEVRFVVRRKAPERDG